MKIKNLTLQNVGRFETLKMNFAPTENVKSNFTVIIGNNGSGKTTILNSIATSLSWFIARLKGTNSKGQTPTESLITNNATSLANTITVVGDNYKNYENSNTNPPFIWQITQAREGTVKQFKSSLKALDSLVKDYQYGLTHNTYPLLPVLALYSVERTIMNVALESKKQYQSKQISVYDNAFKQSTMFDAFFEWFRYREDIENEQRNSHHQRLQSELSVPNLNSHTHKLAMERYSNFEDQQLKAVRTAIRNFMDGFNNLRIERAPDLRMLVDKNEETFDILQLSQGEKCLMALVGDIARRLAVVTPDDSNSERDKYNSSHNNYDPLHGKGIILIDEIDLHLHPTWQRNIIERLRITFPNCQFILTSHSPLVISDAKDILLYSIENGELTKEDSQYGQDVNSVLLDVMDTRIRNKEIERKFEEIFTYIQNNNFKKAKNLIQEIEKEIDINNIDLIESKLILRKQELRYAEDR